MKLFFTPKEIMHIASISYKQLEYWDRTDLVKSTVENSSKKSRVYNFEDLLLIYIINYLRTDHSKRFSVQSLRKRIQTLRELLNGLGDEIVGCTVIFDKKSVFVTTGKLLMADKDKESYVILEVSELMSKVSEVKG